MQKGDSPLLFFMGARGIPGGGNRLYHLSSTLPFLAENALQSRVESGNLQA